MKSYLPIAALIFLALLVAVCQPAAEQPEPVASSGPLLAQGETVEGLLRIFDEKSVVALGERHWVKQDSDFRIRLVQHPKFSEKVNDIVVEFGNSLYQEILDRYVGGEAVSREHLQQVWRNTTQLKSFDSPVYEEFFTAVRSVNQKLPKSRQLRVWAGGPPIDWSANAVDFDRFSVRRGRHPASIVVEEILAKGRKALLIYGGGHFYRNNRFMAEFGKENLSSLIEKHYPRDVFVVASFGGPSAEYEQLEARLEPSGSPTFIRLGASAVGLLDATLFVGSGIKTTRRGVDGKKVTIVTNPFSGRELREVVDGCVYFGRAEIVSVRPDPAIYNNTDYSRELERRWKVVSYR